MARNKNGELVALKALKKRHIAKYDEQENLRNELQVFKMATAAKFPFLVQMKACWQDEQYYCFEMEFVEGGDLMYHIQRRSFTVEEVRLISAEVVCALDFLHRHDIIYRDLKLDNVMLTREGHVKLADYGLCKPGISPEDTTSTYCGTPDFMAPEIVLEQPYTRTVDHWTLGVLLYELLLGKAPFVGKNETALFKSILQAEVKFPSTPKVPSDAKDLIRKVKIPFLASEQESRQAHHLGSSAQACLLQGN